MLMASLIVASLVAVLNAPAAIITKADNTNALGGASSWVGSVAPGAGDIANWSGVYSASPDNPSGLTNSLKAVWSGTAVSWQGISVGALTGTALTTNTFYAGTSGFGAETNIQAASQSGNIVTITTRANHGYAPGMSVTIAGVTPAGYNGTFTVLGVPSSTTFTYSTGSGLAAGTAFGTVEGAIYIGGTGTAVASSTLAIGSSGIDLSAASHSVVVSANSAGNGFSFAGNQTWNVAAGRNLRIGNGGISAAGTKVTTSGVDGIIDISGGGVVDCAQGGGGGMADVGGFTGFTGKWRVNSGATLRGLRNGATAWGSNPGPDSITLNGGTLAVGGMSGAVGNWTWTNGITLATGTTSTIDEQNVTGGSRSLLLNGAIHGSGNLVFRESLVGGTTFTSPDLGFILTGDNDFSGTVTIGGPVENGVAGRLTFLRVGGVGGDSTATGVGASGSLGTATITNNGVLTFSRTDSHTVAGSIHGTGSLRVGYTTTAGSESQNVTLSGVNTYSGDTRVNMGTLTLPSGVSIPNSANIYLTPLTTASLITVTLDVTGAGGLALSSGQRLVGGANNATLDNTAQVLGNVTAGAGSAIVPGGTNVVNTLAISGNLTLSGGAALVYDLAGASGDLLTVQDLNASGVTTFAITPPGGGLTAGDYPLITASGTLGGSPANFALTGLSSAGTRQAFAIVYDGGSVKLRVTGSPGALTWRGDGAANLWNSSTANWINGGLPDVFFTGDNVTFDDSGSNTPPVSLVGAIQPGSFTVSAAQNYTIAGGGKLSGNGGLTNLGPGTLSIVTSNDFTGKTVLLGGTLSITNESALGADPATFAADQLILDGGALALGFTAPDGFGSQTNRGLTVGAGGGTLNIPAAITLDLSNRITGAGDLTKAGSAALNLRTANPAFTGSAIISGGSAKLFSPYAIGGSGFFGGKLVIKQGVFDLNGLTTYANNGQTSERTWLHANAITLTLGGGAPGSTASLIDSSGTNGFGVFLGAPAIRYDATGDPGMATISAIWKMNGRSISDVTQVEVGDSASTAIELDFTGGMSRPDLLEGKQSTVEKTGPGTMRISCPNYYPGLRITDGTVIVNDLEALGLQHTWANLLNDANLVTVNGGTLDLNGFSNQIGGLAGSGGSVVNNGSGPSVFNLGNNDTNIVNSDYAGAITDGTSSIAVIKRGSGQQILSGFNTYTGGTTISNGALLVNGSVAGAVVARAGTTVGGGGAIGGVLTVDAGATLAPGGSIGTLTLGSSPVLNGAVLAEVDRNDGITFLADQVAVTGNPIAYAGTLVITNTGAPLQAGDTFTLFNASGYSGGFSIVSQTPGQVITWNTANLTVNGTISVATAVGAPITAVKNGNNLDLAWPASAIGAQLQVQTNAITVGLGANWFVVPGSTGVNAVSLPIDPANPTVFLRLVYPPQP